MEYLFYVAALGCLIVSWLKDRDRTLRGLQKAWKSLETLLPQLLGILLFTGMVIAWTSPERISRVIGAQSGWLGTLGAAVIGSLTLIPGFVAFPMAAVFLKNGGGYTQIAAFVSTLMMVGVVTYPMERRYFGTKVALVRNLLAFLFSFFVAGVIGWVHGA
ncbi:MAG: permease [Spirochaetes bacterium]|nr:permease [Spirochaetota bacterium]